MVEGIHVITLKFAVVTSTVETALCDASASQMMKIISMTAVTEMQEPTDEMVFHVVYASG